MGFAQRHSNSYVQYDGDKQDWVDKCDGAQDPWAQKNPSGAGTYKDEKTGGSFPGVGVECQGFSQVKDDVVLPSGGNAAWPEKCDPSQDTVAQKNPSGAGTHEDTNKGSFPGVGVDCQGFAQTTTPAHRVKPERTFFKDCPGNLPDCNGTNGTPGVHCC